MKIEMIPCVQATIHLFAKGYAKDSGYHGSWSPEEG
jgi:hypothetical protein